jgi:methanogenic corrinoid protein MtbC1
MSERQISDLASAIVELKLEETMKLLREKLAASTSPRDIVTKDLAVGLNEVGRRFSDKGYFLSDLLFAATIMDECMNILKPLLEKDAEKSPSVGKAVVGTVKGDMHDIGKNIFVTLMRAAGFEVHDLGVDIPAEKFIDEVEQVRSDILGMSALLSTTAPYFGVVIDELEKAGLRNKTYALIGGPQLVTAEEVGADAFCNDAYLGVKKALEHIKTKS